MLSNLETGDRIQCRFKGKDYYYPAKIMQMEGDRLMVQYDFQDGTAEDPAWHEEEWTSFAMVRV